jgi:cathepsin C
LSTQELLCETNNQGCKGGYLNLGLDYAKKGLLEESTFPFTGDSEPSSCNPARINGTQVKQKIESYCLLFGEDDIKREIFKNGPVISTTQVHIDFLTYKSGSYSKGDEVPKFSQFQAVKIVGWGTESGTEQEPNKGNKYWIIQNSWGPEWGDGGYAKVASGQEFLFEQYAYAIKLRGDKVDSQPKPQNKTQSGQDADNQEKDAKSNEPEEDLKVPETPREESEKLESS